MASSFYIITNSGSPLLFRIYRDDIPDPIPQIFQKKVIDNETHLVRPVFDSDGITFVYIRVNDVYLLLCSKININPLLQLVFLNQLVKVLESYFSAVSQETVRDNFVIIYELLDEVMDFGYPQITEDKILKEYITQKPLIQLVENSCSQLNSLPQAVTGVDGATPWRLPGKKYRKNQIFLDILEKVNILVGKDGNVLSSEINGKVMINCALSGMPELQLGLNTHLAFLPSTSRPSAQQLPLDDVSFHQCVKLNQYQKDQIIGFVPPDGTFDLMKYRTQVKTPPITIVNAIMIRHGSTRVELQIMARSTYSSSLVASFIEFHIPIPTDAISPASKSSTGSLKYRPEISFLVWTLKSVSGGKEYNARTQYTLPTIRGKDALESDNRPISVRFEIPYYSASGIKVRFVHIVEKSSYTSSSWVRYITNAGDYQVRFS